jgi:hypothetical protein
MLVHVNDLAGMYHRVRLGIHLVFSKEGGELRLVANKDQVSRVFLLFKMQADTFHRFERRVIATHHVDTDFHGYKVSENSKGNGQKTKKSNTVNLSANNF